MRATQKSAPRIEARPHITIPLRPADRVLEVVAFVLLLTLWVYTFASYSTLPEIIPVHFDLEGNADRRGSPGIIWLFPVIASIIYFLLTVISRYPHSFNYPRPITHQNAAAQYAIALRMLRSIKLGIVALMLFIVVLIVLTAQGRIAGPGAWVIAAPILLVILPVVWYLRQAYRAA